MGTLLDAIRGNSKIDNPNEAWGSEKSLNCSCFPTFLKALESSHEVSPCSEIRAIERTKSILSKVYLS